ncbi:MAG: stilbene synthase [Cephaloticoccus sp.]|nr:stilbene synthase [Cephaloticoccus sp.]MCF7760271.1 stilbene synthase [Cephaloticoccus sp.]
MYLQALATAVPSGTFSQQDCWRIIEKSPIRNQLNRRSRLLLHGILRGENGIAQRHFATPDIEGIFDRSADELHANFRAEGPRLAARALTAALAQCKVQPQELDALLICTCTGYLCPGLTSYVAELLNLRPNAFLQDLVGLGCGAAIPTIRAASHVLAAQPKAIVACVAVEICSAAFYLDDDPGVLISACLFSDGAAATVWRNTPGPTGLRCFDFNTHHQPEDRDRLRFEQRDGKLRNLLDRTVPELAAGAVARLWQQRGPRPVGAIIAHPGGKDVLAALAPLFTPHSLEFSAGVLRDHGNMSSPSVLFALDAALQNKPVEGDFWLVSFGAGFSAHTCRLGHDWDDGDQLGLENPGIKSRD